MRNGPVSSRVALLLRSAEIKPLLSDLFFLILFGTVVLKDLESFLLTCGRKLASFYYLWVKWQGKLMTLTVGMSSFAVVSALLSSSQLFSTLLSRFPQ